METTTGEFFKEVIRKHEGRYRHMQPIVYIYEELLQEIGSDVKITAHDAEFARHCIRIDRLLLIRRAHWNRRNPKLRWKDSGIDLATVSSEMEFFKTLFAPPEEDVPKKVESSV